MHTRAVLAIVPAGVPAHNCYTASQTEGAQGGLGGRGGLVWSSWGRVEWGRNPKEAEDTMDNERARPCRGQFTHKALPSVRQPTRPKPSLVACCGCIGSSLSFIWHCSGSLVGRPRLNLQNDHSPFLRKLTCHSPPEICSVVDPCEA